jgi:hypothetical protein
LNNNALKGLDSDVFRSQISLKYLFLDNNQLTSLGGNLLDQAKEISFVRISHNSFVCDCGLLWLYELSRRAKVEGHCKMLENPLEIIQLKDLNQQNGLYQFNINVFFTISLF